MGSDIAAAVNLDRDWDRQRHRDRHRDRDQVRVPARESFRSLLDPNAWQRLPPAVRRRFERHLASGESVIFVGEVAETRRTAVGWVWAQIARLAGAPLPLAVLAHTPAIVVVTADAVGDAQLWTRIYREPGRLPQVIRSLKSFTGPTGLEERVGAGLAMSLVVAEEQRALVFEAPVTAGDSVGSRWVFRHC